MGTEQGVALKNFLTRGLLVLDTQITYSLAFLISGPFWFDISVSAKYEGCYMMIIINEIKIRELKAKGIGIIVKLISKQTTRITLN